MWAVALRNGHESFHFVRNGVVPVQNTKASSHVTWMVCAPVVVQEEEVEEEAVCGCLVPARNEIVAVS